MPLPEELTLYIRVWTQQACVACGAEFRQKRKFKVMRRDTYRDDTLEKIEADWTKAALEAAERCPCPHCGWIQPDMVATDKAVAHGMITAIGFGILILNFILTLLLMIPRDVGSLIAAGVALVALVFHLDQAVRNPNRHRDFNLDDARERVGNELLELTKVGGDRDTVIIHAPIQGYLASAACLLGAAFLFASTACLDWPLVGMQPLGIVVFIAAGCLFASFAYGMKERALPKRVVEVNTTQVLDDSVPPDFQRRPIL